MAVEISQGRQMNEEHEAFSAYLISLFKPKDSKEFDDIIAKLSEKEISDLYKQFKTMEGVTFAKMGAKLDYLQRLNGKCPDGYEVEKYLAGGCVKCKKKLLKNTPLMDKCGGQVKKRIKKAEHGDEVTVKHTRDLTGTTSIWRTISKAENTGEEGVTDTTYTKVRNPIIGKRETIDKGSVTHDRTHTFRDLHGNRTRDKRVRKVSPSGRLVSGNYHKLKKEYESKKTGGAFKHIDGGPGMTDSTKGAILNPKQNKATNGKRRI